MHMKNVLIVEGPAGAGKSTFVDIIEQGDYMTFQPPISLKMSLGKRSFSPLEAVLMSASNDYSKMMFLTTTRKPNILVDRMFSQAVYGALRMNMSVPQVDLSARFTDLQRCVSQELQWRATNMYEEAKINLGLVVLLPSVETLTARRRLARKEYPWSPEAELKAYHDYFMLWPGLSRKLVTAWDSTHDQLSAIQWAYAFFGQDLGNAEHAG